MVELTMWSVRLESKDDEPGFLHEMTTTDPDALRLAAIVSCSDDAIISQSLDGIIETWNPAAERMFGYTAAEAVGQHVELIVAPEHRDDDKRATEQVRSGTPVHHLETVAITKSGLTVDVSLALSPVVTPDGAIIGVARIARDISRQKLVDRDLARLAAIVNSADDAIVSKNLDGIVRTWNQGAERLFGFTADEIIGKSITLIIPPERLAEEEHVLSEIRAGHSVRFETVRRHKDGHQIDISLSVSPVMTPDGRIVGASKIARDISEERRLARAAEEANRVKDEFLAMLSHELRTPLNAVLGYTRMLRQGHYSKGRQDRTIETIERNANILGQLVSDVLDVSTIVSGKIQLKPKRCDLVNVTESAVDVVRPSADAKGVALTVHAPHQPIWAQCDTNRLRQVLWNLLANAVKFTPAEGQIIVRIEEHGRQAIITVSDTGAGISAESLPYIFQRFWQGERRDKYAQGGLGLGLALARHFTELHGGTITAASEGEGHGATFTVVLPLSGQGAVVRESAKEKDRLRQAG